MKTFKFLKSTLIASTLAASISIFAQDKIVPYTEVPAEIQTYLKTHFPNNTVLQSELDNGWFKKEYEILLSNNVKLEFNEKNNIKNIDAKSALPESVIPSAISKYIKSNYPNNFITEWDLDAKRQSVELNNGVELEFNLEGKFLRIDQ